ncbi:hypothetical protein L1987_71043 [Smallanthus sonchifolius]|uniref:Uncharacterized protein n=1 Tax=Smallanthus sonchifolius TaxID=185202 RepID=A0ACB9AS04_9ASTR|nr:hypothetical protein L1987_71043 [Smallanthus sonchifolius]
MQLYVGQGLAIGTWIAPFRSFLWKIFFEWHEDYKEFEKMKEMKPDNLRVDFAVRREQTNEKGEKIFMQTRMAQYDRIIGITQERQHICVYVWA